MSDLCDTFVSGRQLYQLLRLRQRRGQRLFNQHIDSSLHQFARDSQMMDGGRRDSRGPQFAVCGEHLVNRAECLAAELASYCIGAGQIRVDHPEQAHRLALQFEFFVHSGMIASEDAHAHYRDRDRIVRWQEKFSMAGCRKEIVNAKQGKSIRMVITKCCN
jgi:hypothetical protein